MATSSTKKTLKILRVFLIREYLRKANIPTQI